MSALDDLITAVEGAEGPSREIDEHVFATFAPHGMEVFHRSQGLDILPPGRVATRFDGRIDFVDTPLVTASIDAVDALIRRVMPDYEERVFRSADQCHVDADFQLRGVRWGTVEADKPTEPLARLLAFLRAARARQENDNG